MYNVVLQAESCMQQFYRLIFNASLSQSSMSQFYWLVSYTAVLQAKLICSRSAG